MDFQQMLVPSKDVVLDGKTYTLHFNFNTLAHIERLLGGNALQIVADLYEQFEALQKSIEARQAGKNAPIKIPVSVTQLRAVLSACLVEAHPEMTPEALGRLIHLGNIRKLFEGFAQVASAAFGPAEAGQSGPPVSVELAPG